jgi:N-acetylglucosamine kinase-like BadF-type ATPase
LPPERPRPVSDLLLGVDGGNTKTLALVACSDGTVVGAGSAGQSDIHNASSPAEAIEEVARAVAGALDGCGAGSGDLAAAAFSLAGADWPEDFELLRRGLSERIGLAVAPLVVNDTIGAVRCGTEDGVGVAVVCGTHGTAGARNAAGDVYHFGFWPDDAGARALASQALAAVWRAHLGIGPSTTLIGRALEWWGASDALELLHSLTRLAGPGITAHDRDLFAEAVLDEADARDDVAAEIVRTAGARLGSYARVCAARTGQEGAHFPLVLCGGVLRHPSVLLRESVISQVPDAVPVYPTLEPAAGAVLLAADAVGVHPRVDMLQSPLLSLPGQDDTGKH